MVKASEHILEIDIAKGIGIVCVFVGHLTFWGTPVSKFVFGFHLSLFFFLSGLVFLPDKDVRSHVKRLWLSFGVPYLFFCALGLIPYSMGLFDRDPNIGAVLVSTCFRGHPVENGPLWFLMSLAGTQAAYWLLVRRIKREILIVMGSLFIALVMILALREFPMGRKWIPLKLETLPLAVFFFSTGRMVSQNVREFMRRSSLFTCVAVSCCALLLMLTILPHTKASCLQGAQIRDGLFFVMSFLGIVFVVSLASAWRSILPKFSGGGGVMCYIGRNSLIFFCMEFVTLPFLIALGKLLVTTPIAFYPLEHQIPLCYSLALFILQLVIIALCVPMISRLLKNLREVIGKR